jgi:hypothetical protein
MPGVRRAELCARLATELAGRRVHLDPAILGDLGPLLPEGTVVAHSPAEAEVLVVCADAVAADGSLEPDGAPETPGTTVFAVVDPLRVVERAPGAGRRAVARVFSSEAVLDCTSEGLVIVELAPGLSARDLQASFSPTLKITHELVEYGSAQAARGSHAPT